MILIDLPNFFNNEFQASKHFSSPANHAVKHLSVSPECFMHLSVISTKSTDVKKRFPISVGGASVLRSDLFLAQFSSWLSVTARVKIDKKGAVSFLKESSLLFVE